jgi:hypothetical protein
MPIEAIFALPISVRAGDLEVLNSGTVLFSPEKGFRVTVGGITIEFIFQNAEQGTPEINRNAVPDSLTFQYIIKGMIPSAPAGMGLKYADGIGTAQGFPIYFSFALSVLVNDQKAISMNYAVYRGIPAPIQAPVEGEARNG